jgi:rod shape-determining protein MreC
MGAAANPIYSIVQAPRDLWAWMTDSFADRDRLRTENTEISEQLRLARIKLLQFDSLREENRRLRAVREASAGVGGRTLISEIIHVDVDPFRHRVRINKGADDGVFRGQPVLDAFGIVGQVVQVDKYTATLILISDAEHAIPVLINRNGIRSIAVGTGDLGKLSLPYMTVESDVKAGDLLVSSGLDDIFPAGYPVAQVTRVERNPAETFALVEAKPLAQLDRDREVLLLWADKDAAPPAASATRSTSGPEVETPRPAETKPAAPKPTAPAATSTPKPKKPAASPTPSSSPATTPGETPAETPTSPNSGPTTQAPATAAPPTETTLPQGPPNDVPPETQAPATEPPSTQAPQNP